MRMSTINFLIARFFITSHFNFIYILDVCWFDSIVNLEVRFFGCFGFWASVVEVLVASVAIYSVSSRGIFYPSLSCYYI